MEILITNEANFEFTTDLEELLKKVSYTAVSSENIGENVEISFLFVDNEQIREINKKYRKLDRPTDVLSFPQLSPEEINLGDEPQLLGDIVISIEKTREQAAEYGHSFNREFGFLAIHGILHLLGYDHMDDASEEEMCDKQRNILKNCGIS